MKIPQEIQDLMPERKKGLQKIEHDYITCYECGSYEDCDCEGFNQALTEVEAVLPQMLALAEKRGAEREQWRIGAQIEEADFAAKVAEKTGNAEAVYELQDVLKKTNSIIKTQPNHEK